MSKKPINQNHNYNLNLINSIGFDYYFSSSTINRITNKVINSTQSNEEKKRKLELLKQNINSIKDCKLKENANCLILGNGNINSKIMLIGGAPGEKENETAEAFTGEDGILLEKMLAAINIKKKNIYMSYAINYYPRDDRKPSSEEIKRYSSFLQKHISIINPKIIILLGSTAMYSLLGLNNKISSERGNWKELIIENTNYHIMITFDPSYLLRAPENKKFSWDDLKKIKQKIEELDLTI